MPDEENRGSLTGALWFFSTLIMIAIFISAGLQGDLTLAHIIFASMILAINVIATPFLLRWKGVSVEQEKAKRERIDTMLRDMSDSELLELKQRLSDGDFHNEQMLDYLSDDGELIWHK